MKQTPFHHYYTARTLEAIPCEERLVPVYASSNNKVYPFQVTAANFALRSPYQKGAVLCDEAGLGKSHEATLIITQKWLEGQRRILLAVPNADFLCQWTTLMDEFYSVPYTVLSSRAQWDALVTEEEPNPFLQDAVVITTYEFAAANEESAKAVSWDLTVFEEANALSAVYQEGNQQAKTLKRIAGSGFKLLLTGTPIEKNIMDLYGLIWFIDETVLPDDREFLARYLRRPERYPELSEMVRPYCFRTLRAQAASYAKVPRRVLHTYEYDPTAGEHRLYDLLYAYVNQRSRLAFPEMDPYDLALRLLGLLGSSTAAILQTIRGIIRRLEGLPNAQVELDQWREMETAALEVEQDAKAAALPRILELGFSAMKKRGAAKKAVIFTESVETQRMLCRLLEGKFKTLAYRGGVDYAAIQSFKDDGEVLLSTDNGARGFNLEEAAFVIHFDLPYNTLKLEQRIDRCQRLGQENDVLSLAFINRDNLADVRKLELASKRTLVSDGVFGLTDSVLGGFTDDLRAGFWEAEKCLRPRAQVEADYQETLVRNEEENRRAVSAAEDILFTSFTRELAQRVNLSPRYVSRRAGELNEALWRLAKSFFLRYNEINNDCVFVIDDEAKTVTATEYRELPVLFYYWTGTRNRPYRSQKHYGMGSGFKPRAGQITFSSIIGQGILRELECADFGTLTVEGNVEPCQIGLYTVTLLGGIRREFPVLCGVTDSGRTLGEDECKALLALPVKSFTEDGPRSPHWLKGRGRPHEMDKLVPVGALVEREASNLSPAQTEEMERMKLRCNSQKAALTRKLDGLEARVKALEADRDAVAGDRLKRLALEKQATQLRRELMKGRESQFFDAMRLDMELEEQVKQFAEQEKLNARVTREFVIKVEGSNDSNLANSSCHHW